MSRMTDFTVPSTVPGRTLHAFRLTAERVQGAPGHEKY